MAELRIALLGPARVEVDGAPIQVDTRKAVALLAYLAVTGDRQGRDAVAGLLWPDYDQDHARAALRRTLSALGKALGGGWLAADRTSLGLDTGGLWLDVGRFADLLAACGGHGHPVEQVCQACLEPLAEAAALHRGDFMAGFTLRDADPFDDWRFFEAERLRRELAGVLERLVAGLAAAGRHRQVGEERDRLAGVDLDRCAVQLDPRRAEQGDPQLAHAPPFSCPCSAGSMARAGPARNVPGTVAGDSTAATASGCGPGLPRP